MGAEPSSASGRTSRRSGGGPDSYRRCRRGSGRRPGVPRRSPIRSPRGRPCAATSDRPPTSRYAHGSRAMHAVVLTPADRRTAGNGSSGATGRGILKRDDARPWTCGSTPVRSDAMAAAVTLGRTVRPWSVEAPCLTSRPRVGSSRSGMMSGRRPSATTRMTRLACHDRRWIIMCRMMGPAGQLERTTRLRSRNDCDA